MIGSRLKTCATKGNTVCCVQINTSNMLKVWTWVGATNDLLEVEENDFFICGSPTWIAVDQCVNENQQEGSNRADEIQNSSGLYLFVFLAQNKGSSSDTHGTPILIGLAANARDHRCQGLWGIVRNIADI